MTFRFLTFTVLLVGLAQTGTSVADDHFKYYWSSYEYDMFYAIERPNNFKLQENLEATLLKIIKNSDTSGRKPPPGILAEYGFFLYERGDIQVAISYFEREAGQWPESKVLMERVIARLQQGEQE